MQFLTKNYPLYLDPDFCTCLEGFADSSRIWLGATALDTAQIQRASLALAIYTEFTKYICIEPLRGFLTPKDAKILANNGIDWVIVGAETGTRRTRKIPKEKK